MVHSILVAFPLALFVVVVEGEGAIARGIDGVGFFISRHHFRACCYCHERNEYCNVSFHHLVIVFTGSTFMIPQSVTKILLILLILVTLPLKKLKTWYFYVFSFSE